MGNIDKDYEKEYQEFLERMHQEDEYEEYIEFNTGINALDMAYLFDKEAAELLSKAFYKSIEYIIEHTGLTEKKVKNLINKCIMQIEFKEEYPENPNGIGYVSNLFYVLSIKKEVLKEEPEYIYKFIRHEITHMIGSKIINLLIGSNRIIISGYSRENAFDIDSKKENEYFNESAVDMFVNQDEKFREEKILDYTIYTNQELNAGIYCLNSNLIHQMIIARGIKKQEFFKGLYDYKKSKQVIKKFKNNIFKKLSLNMDDIYDEINKYYDYEDEVYMMQKEDKSVDVSKQLQNMNEHKIKLENIVAESERLIIDEILIPRLRKMDYKERQQLLDEYYNFIISEKEYFRLKTNYKAITISNKQKAPWFKHIDVDKIEIKDRLQDDRVNKENSIEY